MDTLPSYLQQKPPATIFLVSGPSGVGKDTLMNEVLKMPGVERVVTTTTRSMREDERQGVPYEFVKTEEFEARAERDEFFERSFHYGHWYGITHRELQEKVTRGGVVLWKVDMNGVKTIAKELPYVITIAILPDTERAPEQRSRKRGANSEHEIAQRLREDRECVAWLNEHAQHRIINREGRMDVAIREFQEIIHRYAP